MVCLKLFYVIYRLWKSILWSVISIMCSGAGINASGVERVSGMCVAGRLFRVMFAVAAFIKLA